MIDRINKKLGEILKVSQNLSRGTISKFNIIFWYVWLIYRHRLGVSWGGARRLKLRYMGKDFYFYSNYSTDVAVLEEVFIRGEYKMGQDITPKFIFDLGSNTGVSAIFFSIIYPEATIYAFEPDPNTFKILELNAEGMGNIIPMNIAVTNIDAPIKFFIYPNSTISSSLAQRIPCQQSVEVSGRNLESLMKELNINKIDLLKFDVEGAEKEIFSSIDTKLVDNFVGELHTDLAHTTVGEFTSLFPNHKIKVSEISASRYILRT